MADPVEGTAHAASHGTKGATAFLTKKVGPLPVWVWMAAAIAVYLYYSHQQKGSGTGPATDPAGNVGTIDPATGFVYGSPEDQAALAAASPSGTSSTDSGNAGQNATTGAQTYADNNAWGSAAINYLVGLGIDATTANQAVQQYLSSQTLTTAQQGDVNLAIQALGPPPSLPGPTTGNPPPVTTPGGGTTPANTTPTVSGGKVKSVNNTGAVVTWTGTGATQWKVQLTGPGSENGRIATVTSPQATYSGLESGHDYSVSVQPLVGGKPTGTPGTIDFKTTGGTPATTGKK